MYAIPNLAASAAFEVDPWNFEETIPEQALTNKATFTAWGQKPTTQHCYFSAAEGLDPLRRISTDNPTAAIGAIVGDYDSPTTHDQLLDLVHSCPVEFVPNWASLTFSKGARLVWLFQQPVSVMDDNMATAFYKLVYRKLKLNKMLAGFDEEAFFRPSQYYERGREWLQLSKDLIPHNFPWQWVYEAGEKLKWEQQGTEIPMNLLADAVKAKFPGKWKGPFAEGNRGIRFWDPEANNESAAVVRSTGMQCFTGHTAFVPWSEIFGHQFVAQFEADRTGQLIADTYYDGKYFWIKNETDVWVPVTPTDYRLRLKVKYDLSGVPKRKENASEIDRVMFAVQESKAVSHALPFVHFPDGPLRFNGQAYLNTSTLRCMEPSPPNPDTDWGVGFPWLANFLENLFHPSEQLDYFMSWWKHFYVNAYNLTPRQGQALFLAGSAGVGKTLLTTGIIAPTVGGFMEASAYLLGQEKFTAHIVSSPIMAIDDALGAASHRAHIQYSAMLKKIIANQHILYEEKFMKAGLVNWLGRPITTCNMDSESIRIIPDSEISILDKICLFKCNSEPIEFPPAPEIKKILRKELPYLCRFLTDWPIPDHCVGDSRYGVKSYHEATLYTASLQTSASFSFLELLLDYLSSYKSANQDAEVWKGTATRLLSDMLIDAALAPIANKYTPNQIASSLGQLKARGYPIDRVRSATKREWTLPIDLMITKVDHNE
jgi:hypothetical protein